MDNIINNLMVGNRQDTVSAELTTVFDLEQFKCNHCQRGFTTIRGLSTHHRACAKNNKQSQSLSQPSLLQPADQMLTLDFDRNLPSSLPNISNEQAVTFRDIPVFDFVDDSFPVAV